MNQVPAYFGVHPIQYFLLNLSRYRMSPGGNRRARRAIPINKAPQPGIAVQKKARAKSELLKSQKDFASFDFNF